MGHRRPFILSQRVSAAEAEAIIKRGIIPSEKDPPVISFLAAFWTPTLSMHTHRLSGGGCFLPGGARTINIALQDLRVAVRRWAKARRLPDLLEGFQKAAEKINPRGSLLLAELGCWTGIDPRARAGVLLAALAGLRLWECFRGLTLQDIEEKRGSSPSGNRSRWVRRCRASGSGDPWVRYQRRRLSFHSCRYGFVSLARLAGLADFLVQRHAA
jgi:hypothetical protein